ncbi:DUF4402 domain-containing protein [Aurantiacibacter aquimixticola]|uniref:DUF4402 domain-containing protein n=1 Tax=Aurantiacibacter aquimixticola TaxID=1958945 RepID=UPI001403480F|nr:DUF4402 domain-containing protein [Aurantiacibacter aquimixticola]
MKKFAVLAATAAAFTSTSAFAQALDDNQAEGSATAEVVAPITLTHVAGAELSFGTFTAGAGGTVVVTRGGAGSTTGDVVLLAGSNESSDEFTVAGDANRRFSITVNNGTITHTNGTDTMAFVPDARANHTLDAAGAADFTVGGALTVGADQEAGDYAGTYLVEVAYN